MGKAAPGAVVDVLSHREIAFLLDIVNRTHQIESAREFSALLSMLGHIIPIQRVVALAGKIGPSGELDKILKIVEHGPEGWFDEYRHKIGPQSRGVMQYVLSCDGMRILPHRFPDVPCPDTSPGGQPVTLCENSDSVIIGRTTDRLRVRNAFVFSGQGIVGKSSFVSILEYVAPHFHLAMMKITLNDASSNGTLTEREKEVLQWTGVGKTSWETARILQVAERTVVFHVQNAMKKLGASKRSQAVARAVAQGLIHLG